MELGQVRYSPLSDVRVLLTFISFTSPTGFQKLVQQ